MNGGGSMSLAEKNNQIHKSKEVKNSKHDVLEKVVTEEMISRYYELQQQSKEIEKEMNKLKKQFHDYFDLVDGEHSKAEKITETYSLQRQIRVATSYDDTKTIQLLKDLQLEDCIQKIEKPDQERIEAAITLGLLEKGSLLDCIQQKYSQAIVVRKL